jgi:F420-0:gamma-glutamyl ligase
MIGDMNIIPVRTRILLPPRDDLFAVLDEALPEIKNGDIVIVTSKVVSLNEGRTIPIGTRDKAELVRTEADLLWHPDPARKPLTITRHALISAAGIDESNGNGHYVLLPVDAFASARHIRDYLVRRFSLEAVGVVITDSHSLLFRYGALSVSVGCWGFVPVVSHKGEVDLFGRELQFSKTNVADALAAAATLVSGEGAESIPVQIARGVPNLTFTDTDPRPALFVPQEEDTYRQLYRNFTDPNSPE